MDIVDSTRSFERWLGKHVRLRKDDLRYKHSLMAADTFSFLRATFYRWAQLWPEAITDLAQAPRVLSAGDLHVENYGTWRDAEGRLVWGMNDFDEAARLPFTADLVRLATRAGLAAAEGVFVDSHRLNRLYPRRRQTDGAGREGSVAAKDGDGEAPRSDRLLASDASASNRSRRFRVNSGNAAYPAPSSRRCSGPCCPAPIRLRQSRVRAAGRDRRLAWRGGRPRGQGAGAIRVGMGSRGPRPGPHPLYGRACRGRALPGSDGRGAR